MKILWILNELYKIFLVMTDTSDYIGEKIKAHEKKGMEMPEQVLISEYMKAWKWKKIIEATGYFNAMKARGIDHKIRA